MENFQHRLDILLNEYYGCDSVFMFGNFNFRKMILHGKEVGKEGSVWGAQCATLYLFLINETGYLLSNKETLLARGTPLGTLRGWQPLTCKYRGFSASFSRDHCTAFYLLHEFSTAHILRIAWENLGSAERQEVLCDQYWTRVINYFNTSILRFHFM